MCDESGHAKFPFSNLTHTLDSGSAQSLHASCCRSCHPTPCSQRKKNPCWAIKISNMGSIHKNIWVGISAARTTSRNEGFS